MIRAVTPSDYPAIRAVLRHAFAEADEADLVEQLREDDDVVLELVAANDIAIFGHIMLSRLRIEQEDETLKAAALAPVSVLPAFQNQGVGSALIEDAIQEIAVLDIAAIVVLGHSTYYPRFGFAAETAARLDAPFFGPQFMALELVPACLRAGGRVRYAKAFGLKS
jgi:putative acetyltransferase